MIEAATVQGSPGNNVVRVDGSCRGSNSCRSSGVAVAPAGGDEQDSNSSLSYGCGFNAGSSTASLCDARQVFLASNVLWTHSLYV